MVKGSDGRSFEEYAARLKKAGGSIEPCPAWGDCRLQALAWRYEVTGGRFSPTPARYPIEDANPFIVRDFGALHPVRALRPGLQRGAGEPGDPLRLPRRAQQDRRRRRPALPRLGLRLLRRVRPGLPDRGAGGEGRPRQGPAAGKPARVRTTCTYCGVGCQTELHVKDNRVVKVTGVEGMAPNYGSLCVKGRFGFDFIGSPERLKTPLIREGDGFREAIVGRGSRSGGPAPGRDPHRLTGRTASGSSPRRASPTRRTTSPRSSRGRCSRPTTSTTAPVSDTAPLWPVWPQRSAAGR